MLAVAWPAGIACQAVALPPVASLAACLPACPAAEPHTVAWAAGHHTVACLSGPASHIVAWVAGHHTVACLPGPACQAAEPHIVAWVAGRHTVACQAAAGHTAAAPAAARIAFACLGTTAVHPLFADLALLAALGPTAAPRMCQACEARCQYLTIFHAVFFHESS